MTTTQNSAPTWWRWGALLLLFVGGLGATLAALGWFFLRPPPRPEGPLPTAVLWTATPTATSTVTPIPTPTPILPTPTLPAAASTGIGSRVRVTGTGASGLNLRSGPGLGNERVAIAVEGETFIIAGGPVDADGISWWLLKDEAHPEREGWAAANYLLPDSP